MIGAKLISRGRDSTQPECIGLRPGILASEFRIEVVLASASYSSVRQIETWKRVGKNAETAQFGTFLASNLSQVETKVSFPGLPCYFTPPD